MAFKDSELVECKALIEKYIKSIRPPVEMRGRIDIDYKIENQSIIIFERYKSIDKKPIEGYIAKTTYLRNWDLWKIYWQRADMKWHLYEPKKEVKELADFIKIIEEDKYHCFWG